MFKYVILLVASIVIIPSVATSEIYPDPPINYDVVREGTIDLRILTLGKKTSLNIGIAGIGFRVDPDNWAEIDLDPTFVDVGLLLCKLPYFNTIFQTDCD